VAVQWLNQALYFYQSLCLVDSEVLRNRHLRVAAKRYEQIMKTNHKFKISILLFTLILISCKASYLTITPIPSEKMDISSELKYIEKTDQTDRKKGIVHIVFNDKKGKLIKERDSIRANRVYNLYNNGLIITDEDKFTAGLIFMHSTVDGHGKVAYDIFSDLEVNGTTISARMNGENWKELVIKQGVYIPENELGD
jgi:hypothetical protein